MPEIGKIFTSRVSGPDEPATPGAEDLRVYDLRFQHTVGEAATLEVECEYPAAGLIGGPRWLIVSVEVDGVEEELARGEILGSVIGLPGEIVNVEVVCRRPDHKTKIDSLYAQHPYQVPHEIEPRGRPRRAKKFLSVDPYIDPVTLDPELDPVAGSAAPVKTIRGDSASDASDVIEMRMDITDMPAGLVEAIGEISFSESRSRVADLFTSSHTGQPQNGLIPGTESVRTDIAEAQIIVIDVDAISSYDIAEVIFFDVSGSGSVVQSGPAELTYTSEAGATNTVSMIVEARISMSEYVYFEISIDVESGSVSLDSEVTF